MSAHVHEWQRFSLGILRWKKIILSLILIQLLPSARARKCSLHNPGFLPPVGSSQLRNGRLICLTQHHLPLIISNRRRVIQQCTRLSSLSVLITSTNNSRTSWISLNRPNWKHPPHHSPTISARNPQNLSTAALGTIWDFAPFLPPIPGYHHTFCYQPTDYPFHVITLIVTIWNVWLISDGVNRSRVVSQLIVVYDQ